MKELRPSPPQVLPTARPYVDQDDLDAVAAAMGEGVLSEGQALADFEQGLCQITGATHAVAMSSGGAARHTLYHALGVGPGRTVMTSANAPVGTATAAQACGGDVEFLEIDPRTANLDVARLEERLSQGSVPLVVTVLHFGGLPSDMEWLLTLKRRYDFDLVEDATHAFGARYRIDDRWYRVGEHPEVTAAVLSFRPMQQISTGEGGAVLTHDGDLAHRLQRLRAGGFSPPRRTPAFGEAGRHPQWFEPLCELGFSYRMSELNAALGASQLRKLPDFLAARREIAMRYMAELRDYELLHPGGPDRDHAFGLFCVRTAPEERDELLRSLRERGIRAGVHYYPLPMQPWFQARGGRGSFPMAEIHARSSLSLPIYPALSDRDQERVIEALTHWRARRAA